MEAIRQVRLRQGLSQRELSRRAGISFKGLQLLEVPGHDARLSTVEKVAQALGMPEGGVRRVLEVYLAEDPASAFCASMRVVRDGFDSWRIHMFDFVDGFRSRPDCKLVRAPPAPLPDRRLTAVLASIVEALCAEQTWAPPGWTRAVAALEDPWFVSGVENLKASALVESPLAFRKRNIFVLSNFLARV